MDMVSVSRRKYNLYKLFILYWAQSPHSKGAELLYRHVLQKPQEEKREEECEGIEVTRKETVYSYMDGYQPPHLLASNHSSDDDDSVKSGIITHAPTTTIVEKEV
ncbi:hypothetical protein INT47_013169 [Mucor saturninus]|uniref:Uncharacterized protein n=1 Tax=Mucor saturninus TaxID=64648 RepID=A0A8H7QVF7_9FUNG|nr:hypothetical protein INT47_013169 [Mucor saturninus]